MKAIPIVEEDQFATLNVKTMDKKLFMRLKNEYVAQSKMESMDSHQFFNFVLLAFQDYRDLKNSKEE